MIHQVSLKYHQDHCKNCQLKEHLKYIYECLCGPCEQQFYHLEFRIYLCLLEVDVIAIFGKQKLLIDISIAFELELTSTKPMIFFVS